MAGAEASTPASPAYGIPPHPAQAPRTRQQPRACASRACRAPGRWRRWRRPRRALRAIVHLPRQPLHLCRSSPQRIRAVLPNLRHHLIVDVRHDSSQLILDRRRSLMQPLLPRTFRCFIRHIDTSPPSVIRMRKNGGQRTPGLFARGCCIGNHPPRTASVIQLAAPGERP